MASLRDALTSMEKSVDGLIQKLTSASAAMSGPGGRVSTGSNFLNNALGAFSTTPSVAAEARFGLGMGVVQGTGRAISGATQMMPDVNATMERMATSYNAALRASSGMSRNQLQQTTLSALSGGLTAPGSDAMVSGYLSMRGMMADTSFGSTYQQTLRSVKGAAQYLNMSNERAVAAIEGLTGASGASGMLRNFGIFTADPRTGKEKTQGQIFQELYGRLTAGRGVATEQETMESFRRGALGATLRASGMSEDQQQLFLQYAIERGRGNEMDLSDPESMQRLMDKAKAEGNANPNLPGYNLNTAKTGAMQNAQEAYLTGIQAVTPVLQGLVGVGGALAGTFGALTAAAGLAASQLSVLGAGNLIAGGAQAGANAGILGAAGKDKGGTRNSYIGNVKNNFKANAGAGLKVGGAFAAVTAVTQLPGVIAATQAGQGGSAIGGLAGSTVGGLAGAAIGQALIPIPVVGALVGGMVGSAIGGMAGQAMGSAFNAEGGDEGSSNTLGSGAPQQFKLLHPTKSAQITAVFGQRESSFTAGKITWPNGHKGIDYAGKQGDGIYASESGYATLHDGGELGKRVRIKHSNGMYTHYCHLSSITIKEGEVSKGSQIGTMGNTGGKSTGVHLHFALSTGPDTSSAIDPMPYLSGGGNYLSSPPQDGEQSPSSNNPTSAGMTSAATNPGGEDSSPVNPTVGSNISENAKVDGISGAGSSPASGLESWSAGSVWSSGGGANTAAAPEGGEDTSDQPGYLSTPTSPASTLRQKNGKESKAVTNNVTINLSIAKGTPEEARRFAHMLKQALEDENAMRAMARN